MEHPKKKKRTLEEQKKKDSSTEEEQLGYTRRRRKQLKSAWSFPLDLTTEILSRLPAGSVLRFRCVSKLWSSITTDPYFINLFETRPSPILILCYKKGTKLFVSSVPQNRQISKEPSDSSPQPIYRYHIKLPVGDYSYFSPTESVHGLICFQESATPIVWSPSKRQFLPLPNPGLTEDWDHINVFLGYDPVTSKHKVMCIPIWGSSNVCRVLTLGSAQESWRTVKINHKHCLYIQTYGRYIKGIIYYVASIPRKKVWVIMSFDVRSEKFNMIHLPSPWDIRNDMLITYMGKLACVYENNGRRLWILEDAEKHEWSSVTHAGEFIYAPSTFHKQYYILFFDPVRKSFRRFIFKGSRGMSNAHALPNHIDSL
ncbi:hypothetical protein EUTSA_v10003356mg [Eutrema salsugineum]|uniref:F-box domain-containing protein n=1 Tax=Eutrema salsugineum TaxID=72664 RepID=V4LQC0_EUTSA|nr:hypothetical protein EUTSA_v10003356mg [Eutrema salsugineum]